MESLKKFRQAISLLRDLQEMDVVIHQTIGMDHNSALLGQHGKAPQITPFVVAVPIQTTAVHSTRHYVMSRFWNNYSSLTSHVAIESIG